MTGPKFIVLAGELRRLIMSGGYAAGDVLPSEADLMEQHGVSRDTVRKALSRLRDEGLIVSRAGVGWLVRQRNSIRWNLLRPETNERTDISPADAWSEQVREQGREPTEQLSVILQPSEPRVAELLGLGPDDDVWIRRRHRYVDGELYAITDTIFPDSIAGGTAIARPRDVLPGTLAVLASIGYPVARNPTTVVCRPATAAEADTFGVRPGDAMVEVTRSRLTAEGQPVAVTVTVAPGDKVEIVLELEGVETQ